jgi:TolB protein
MWRIAAIACLPALSVAVPTSMSSAPARTPTIAFQSAQRGDYDIWSMRLDGSELRNLSHHKGYDSDPAWSPNGRKIVFTSHRTGWPKIFVMNADGGGVRQLTRGFSKDGGAVWTKDGSHIVYGSMPDPPVANAPGWWIMRPDGSRKRPLARAYSGRPSWSPDSRRAALTGSCGLETCVFTMGVDGRRKRRLIDPERVDNSWPAWSPDGREIAWIHATELWIVNADGTAPRRLAPGPLPEVYDHGPSWSPDSSRLVFGTNRFPSGLALIDRDGTRLNEVGRGVVSRTATPVWRPTG